MGSILHIFFLIWKNYKLQLRHQWITAIELIIPVFLIFLLILTRLFYPVEKKEIETVFDAYKINSLPPEFFNTTTTENVSLYYSPTSTFLDDLMQDISSFLNVTVLGFDTEADLEESYIRSSSKVVAGVIFNSNLKNGIKETDPIEYTIRPERFIGIPWNLSYAVQAFHVLQLTDKSTYGTIYASSGFLAIQNAVAMTLMKKTVSGFENRFTIEMNRQPYPPYVLDSFYRVSDYYIAIALVLCYLLPTAMTAKSIVHERDTKLKEMLLLLGVSNLENWTAWFMKEFLCLFILNIIMTAMLCIRFGGAAVFHNSDAGLVLFWLCLYSADVIAFAFFIATFFKKENDAVSAVCILYIITFVPYLHSTGLMQQLPYKARFLLCLLPNTVFAYSNRIIIRLESLGKGLHWDTINDEELLNVDISMETAFVMLGINIVVYLILMWYTDEMLQANLPWYFPLMASYWTGQKNIPLTSPDTSSHFRQSNFFEADQLGVKPMIHLKNLTKKYGEKSLPIIDNVDLKAYKGKITALLGHNCSGKSTFIQMLYGAITPTSGRIIIKSLNLCNANEKRSIIPLIGICPEYNVCLEELTVEENLYFFCYIKGFDFDGTKTEVNHILGSFDLEIRKNLLVSALSPTLQRRLSVAIALIGESEVVFLDEPTLYMDSSSRRLTWDALLLEKRSRAIFFTTSHIKEANAFADRIAVFHKGHLKCCGSPMFLKKKYDAGYILTLLKEPEFNTIRIKSYICSKMPDADIISDTEEEMKFKLPADKSHLYENMLKPLEQEVNDWKIKQMILTETPLEKLFEKITTSSSSQKTNDSNELESLKDANQYPISHALTRKRNEGCSLFIQHMNALFRKNYTFSKRNKMLSLSTIVILPLVLILSNLMTKADTSEINKPEDDEPFDLNVFGRTHVIYGIDPSSDLTIDLGDTYASLLETETMHLVDLEQQNYLVYYIKHALDDGVLYQTKFIIGAVFEKVLNSTLITALYNPEAYHSPVISLLYVHNTILAYYDKEAKYKFHVINNPLPHKDVTHQIANSSIDFNNSFVWAQDLNIGMAILMSSFVFFLVLENTIDFKKLQFIAGLSSFEYWFSSFLYGFAFYLIPCALAIIIFATFETHCLHESKEIGSLALLLVLHGLSSILLIYCWTFCCSKPSTAYIGVFLYYLLGLFLIFIVYKFEANFDYHISEPLNILFTALMPSYCVGRGIYSIHKNCMMYSICDNKKMQEMCLLRNSASFGDFCCLDRCGDSCFYWTSHPISLSVAGIGKQLIALALQPFIFIVVLILLEMDVYGNLKNFYIARRKIRYYDESVINKDVLNEAKRILSSPVSQLVDENHYLVLKDALKFLPHFTPGKFSFGVRKGECFGLIGIDNSGKSAILHMISGSIPLSIGNVYVNGINVGKYPDKVMDKIGFNIGSYSLLKCFTVEETITLFAQIRGIPEKEIPYSIEALNSVLCIPLYLKVKHCNFILKRKVSAALAIIGMPPLILLEEPTAYMDPVSCAETRKAIELAKDEGCTIVLATQKMDDCEALCDRIGILVRGKLSFIGNLQHLKEDYQDGVTVMLRAPKTRQSRTRLTRQAITVKGQVEQIKADFEDAFPEAILKIEITTYLNYFMHISGIKWSKLFSVLERLKFKGMITSYSVCETTLEQIFSYNVASVAYLKDRMKIAEFLKERKRSKSLHLNVQ